MSSEYDQECHNHIAHVDSQYQEEETKNIDTYPTERTQ